MWKVPCFYEKVYDLANFGSCSQTSLIRRSMGAIIFARLLDYQVTSVMVNEILVGLESILDYAGVRLERFDYTLYWCWEY